MTPFQIRSHIKQKVVVGLYVMNLAEALNIHRFRKRAFEISFRRKMEDGIMGLCWGDTDWVDIEINRNGTWREQMEMIYKDQKNGTSTFKDHCDKVRSDNPKG